MKHVIMGVAQGEEFASFERELPLSAEELKSIMGWEEENDYVFDYLLTSLQIIGIEKASSLELPKNLDLYLTCNS